MGKVNNFQVFTDEAFDEVPHVQTGIDQGDNLIWSRKLLPLEAL